MLFTLSLSATDLLVQHYPLRSPRGGAQGKIFERLIRYEGIRDGTLLTSSPRFDGRLAYSLWACPFGFLGLVRSAFYVPRCTAIVWVPVAMSCCSRRSGQRSSHGTAPPVGLWTNAQPFSSAGKAPPAASSVLASSEASTISDYLPLSRPHLSPSSSNFCDHRKNTATRATSSLGYEESPRLRTAHELATRLCDAHRDLGSFRTRVSQ